MVGNRLIAASLIVIATACAGREVDPSLTAEMPRKIVWAWERPEDLEWLDPKTYGVAFLAQSLALSGNAVEQRARRQPLRLAEGMYVIAVTRIESGTKDAARPPDYTDEQAAAWKGKVGKAQRALFIALAGTLASYNEGTIGPGHCDEPAVSLVPFLPVGVLPLVTALGRRRRNAGR